MLKSAPLSWSAVESVFDASTDCVKLIDAEGKLVWMNQGGLCAMEIDDFALFEGGAWCDFWPADGADKVRAALTADPPASSHFTAFCPTAKEQSKWWDVSVIPVEDTFGQHFGYIATSRDVTEREMASQSREILLREMRHRQTNTLTIAAALCSLHAGNDPALRAFAGDMAERFAALGRAQAVMARGESASAKALDAATLLDTLISPCAGPGSVLSFEVAPGLAIPVDQLDVVGVVMAELAVNAAKHGAFGHGGSVVVTADAREGGIHIVWAETGDREVTETARKGGQGLDLMTRIATMNNAVFTVDWNDHGQRAVLALPG